MTRGKRRCSPSASTVLALHSGLKQLASQEKEQESRNRVEAKHRNTEANREEKKQRGQRRNRTPVSASLLCFSVRNRSSELRNLTLSLPHFSSSLFLSVSLEKGTDN